MADVLGVARSNLIEQRQGGARPRGSYRRADDDVILTAIRTVADVRPTYGYRRVTAILNRTRRATGEPLLNHKRLFRLMKQSGLLLQRHTGMRPVRAHEECVIASASNQRWSSDALEITCRNGEVVRVAFAIDTHDREVIAWVASTGGITGQMVRALMLACVQGRFGVIPLPARPRRARLPECAKPDVRLRAQAGHTSDPAGVFEADVVLASG
ncbi:IS3 family transposase [Methylobacterium sp. A49B]